MANPRTKARLEARIRERVAYCLEFEISDPRAAFVTVTKVELTVDLTVASIYYSVYGTEGEKSRVKHMLDAATGFVRGKVGRVLRMRRIPALKWIYDDSIEYQARMDAVIRGALQRDRDINPAAHGDADLSEPEKDPSQLVEEEYLEYLRAKEREEAGDTADVDDADDLV